MRSKISASTKPARLIYHFFWGDFCDWYIEWVKPQLGSRTAKSRLPAWRNIFAALEAALRLLHPVMPFLTEELWHRLPQPAGAQSIALDRFPEPRPEWADAGAERPWPACRTSSKSLPAISAPK